MTISEQDALRRARRPADERGWRWEEPVRVQLSRAYVVAGKATFEVWTNASCLGCNVRIVIDAEDGAVLEAYWLPR
jgi:hypothetical protein